MTEHAFLRLFHPHEVFAGVDAAVADDTAHGLSAVVGSCVGVHSGLSGSSFAPASSVPVDHPLERTTANMHGGNCGLSSALLAQDYLGAVNHQPSLSGAVVVALEGADILEGARLVRAHRLQGFGFLLQVCFSVRTILNSHRVAPRELSQVAVTMPPEPPDIAGRIDFRPESALIWLARCPSKLYERNPTRRGGKARRSRIPSWSYLSSCGCISSAEEVAMHSQPLLEPGRF
jgi:hypothetical protein